MLKCLFYYMQNYSLSPSPEWWNQLQQYQQKIRPGRATEISLCWLARLPRDNDEHIFGPHNDILLLMHFRTYMELMGSMTREPVRHSLQFHHLTNLIDSVREVRRRVVTNTNRDRTTISHWAICPYYFPVRQILQNPTMAATLHTQKEQIMTICYG